jgi:hypothetical protein
MANLETISGRIIEVHLRFTDQWPDLYGAGWMTALVGLYATGEWLFDAHDLRTGYSVVLFGPHGIEYRHPAAERVAELLTNPNVTSIQITFHDERFAGSHSMPPGGFRLAVVNCWALRTGKQVRAGLAALFGLAPHVARS